jgi:uncharacterized protein (DUF58 family)
MEEFFYRVSWRASGAHPGGHASRQQGGGFEFAGHGTFLSNPSPRDIDLRASLRDPLGQLYVRNYRQKSSIPLVVLADLSASMGFKGILDKRQLLARLAASAAWSASRQGDPFGFVACDDGVRSDLQVPVRFHKSGVMDLYDRLLHTPFHSSSATGLLNAIEHLPRRKSLILLVSDFHYPIETVRSLLDTLAHHDVVPIVLWDEAEMRNLPQKGLMLFRDPETGKMRRFLMRPKIIESIQQYYSDRQASLSLLFRNAGRRPLFCGPDFSMDELTRYFFE